jgi:signal transduction histidine kinase
MLTSIIGILTGIAGFIIWDYFDIKKAMIANLSTHAAIIANNSKAAVTFEDVDGAKATLKALRAAPSIIYARITIKKGQSFAEYCRDPNDKSMHILNFTSGNYNFSNNCLNLKTDIIDPDNEKIGVLYLQSDLSEIQQGVIRTVWIGLVIAVIVIFVTYFLSSKLQVIISGPILRLAQVAKDVSENKDYTARAVKHANDEIGQLIEAFNKMLFEIQKRDNELLVINEKLEVRVKERTADLMIANKKLEDLNKELQETIKQLTSANRELSDFAHVAAHDLKAPLRAIGSLAGIIIEDCGHRLDEEGKKYLNTLVRRTERMNDLINGILRYSEISRISGEKEMLDLNKLVDDVITSFAPSDKIKISIENRLPTIYCAKGPVIQIFQNLIGNSIKYMDKSEGWVKIASADHVGLYTFSVADNGPGIEEKYFNKIFTMFQTLARRDDFESTGIGLAMVKKIVELYGGKVWVESVPGNGCTFYFTFPKEKQKKETYKYAKLKADIIS